MAVQVGDIIEFDGKRQTIIHGTDYFDFAGALKAVDDTGAVTISDIISDDHKTLERALHVNGRVMWVQLQVVNDDESAVMITVDIPNSDDLPTKDDVNTVAEWANRRFWMDVDLKDVEQALDTDHYGNELIARFFPWRPVNYGGPWEAMMKSVIHAQIFPGFANNLDKYLCERFGTVIDYNGKTGYLYPTPEELLIAQPDELIEAKFSRRKADYLTTIPRQILDDRKTYDFDDMRSRNGADVIKSLKELHGVGDWTSQNVAMRGLPHQDIFIDEKNTRKELAPIYGEKGKIGKRDFREATEKFAPYRTFACFYTYMRHFRPQQ